MANKYLDTIGLQRLWERIGAVFVQKEADKSLMTTNEHTKLGGIESGAEVNVQPDWSNSDTTSDAYINNKPVNATTTVAGFMSASDKIKLDGVETGANKTIVDSELKTNSTNPVQNKVVFTALNTKVNGLSSGTTNGHVINFGADGYTLSDSGFTIAKSVPSDAVFIDTHYTTHLYVNSSDTSPANAHASSTNGNTTIRLYDNTIAREVINIKGTGSTTVTSDTSGVITINSSDTIYSLPIASSSILGGIKVGTGLTINVSTGVLSTNVTGIKGNAESTYRIGNVNITPTNIGLGNVTNDSQVKRSEMGAVNGVATLDSAGQVPSGQLPSFVDDVIEGYYYNGSFYDEDTHTTLITGEEGKIYVDLSTEGNYNSYRWSGTVYTRITSGDMVAITNAEIDVITGLNAS